MKIKKKQEEENATLAIFCPRCRKKHPEKECPINVIEICGLCTEYHPTNEFPSLPGLKSIFKGGGEPQETSYPPKRAWRQQNPNMFYDPTTQYPQQHWIPPMPYSQWTHQQPQVQPWKQGWRSPAYGNVPFQTPILPTYQQYPSNISQLLPGFNPPALLPPSQLQPQLTFPLNPNQQQQMQAAPNPNPPRPTPIPAQPIPNPNNRPTQPVQNLEVQTFPTYVITPTSLNEIQLRSGKVLNKPNSTVVIREEEHIYDQPNEEEDIPVQEEIPPHTPQPSEIPQEANPPPYPERLLVKKPEVPLGHDLEVELRNVCVNIPLLQAIKYIPIYAKIIRDLCIKNPGRKRKEPPVIKVVGQLSEFISEMPSKYNDPGNPVVTVEINGISLSNTLIDLGATINVMIVDTMCTLQLNHLRPTQTLLELADKSVISPTRKPR
jgi:hypothetical protein